MGAAFFFFCTLQWVTQSCSLLQTHCHRMFIHTARRAVYYLTEEGIPWLVSIRARNKSHVPLLLTARVLQCIGPWGRQGITTEVRRECIRAAPPKHTTPTPPPTSSILHYCPSFFPGSLSKVAVKRHYSQPVKVKIWMSVRF